MAVKQEPFDVGDTIPVEADFTDALDANQDPTDVAVYVKTPAGVVTDVTADLTHPSPGLYVIDVPITEFGDWTVRAEGTGTIPLVRELRFRVRKPDIVHA